MKQKVTNPNEGVKPVAHEKPCDHAVSCSAEEIDILNSYWLAYSNPLIPIIDLTTVFEELKKMVKKWVLNKRDRTNHLKENS